MTRYIPGHRVRLLVGGGDYFPALVAAIERARVEILLESYIFEDDRTGALICDALVQAAGRGVRVCLLLDGWGALGFPQRWREALHEAGAKLLFFHPQRRRWVPYSWYSWTWGRYTLRRLHRKIVTIDGETAFVGGINIIDDWDPGARQPRFDFCLQLSGPLLPLIRRTQATLWRHVCWSQLKSGALPYMRMQNQADPEGVSLAFVPRDNIGHRRSIERMYLQAIREARSRILLAHAYFLPGWRFRRALIKAAERGIEVHILLQGWADLRWVQAATRMLYPEMLGAGIVIHEYQPAHLHAKVMVVDGAWATVGSSNIDPLSLLLAREANIAVRDERVASQLEEELWRAIQENSVKVDGSHLHNRWLRLLSALCFSAVRLGLRLFPTRAKRRYWGN